ncbi:hypothetical protein ACFPN7_30020 [Amycolatopsis halotolerans]|uniref:hypothetical protein n=1 Tax=Amycolatopsis halotolerans TaxID=330083 RepID=UPI00361ECF0C
MLEPIPGFAGGQRLVGVLGGVVLRAGHHSHSASAGIAHAERHHSVKVRQFLQVRR